MFDAAEPTKKFPLVQGTPAKPFRNISQTTLRTYGVEQHKDTLIFNYKRDGETMAQKIRQPDKKFYSTGDIKVAGLYGQHLFNKGKYITIVEGEVDALSAYEMLGSKWPVVSIPTGSKGAKQALAKEFKWLTENFEKIIICFDNDEPGKIAAKECAELLSPQSYVVTLDLKDANEYLQANKVKDFTNTWWNHSRYTPEGIISGSSLLSKLKEDPVKSTVSWPWKGIQDLTFGIRPGELITICAGSGLGKSSVLREIAHHVLKNTTDNIGLMFLEEQVKKTALAMMSIHLDKPLHLPTTEYTEDEFDSAFASTLGTDRLFFFDHFGSNDIDTILSNIRYLAKALNCKFIILDHISIIVSAQSNGDERKAIDECMTKLATTAAELGVHLFLASHLKRPDSKGHEEGAVTSLGQLRGSASIGQLSDIVVGLERNGQAEDMTERNTTHLRVLKNRFSGLTGPCSDLLYDRETGRLSEINLEPEDDFITDDI